MSKQHRVEFSYDSGLGAGSAASSLATAVGRRDGLDAGQTGVCVRILPTTYSQLHSPPQPCEVPSGAASVEFIVRLGPRGGGATADSIAADALKGQGRTLGK